jgi:hypothetical protein
MDVSDGGYVAVSVEGPEGPRVAILAPSTNGLNEIGSYPTPVPATSLVWGSLGGGQDLAVGAGSNVMLIYGPLSRNPDPPNAVSAKCGKLVKRRAQNPK